MSDIDVNGLLMQMRALAEQTRIGDSGSDEQTSGFAELIKKGVDQVNESQQAAGKLAEDFEAGDPETDLADVIVSLQKAGLSFRAMTEVRNRLVSAYQEIMNMPI